MRKFTLILLVSLFSIGALAQRLSQVAMIDLPGRPGFDHAVFANNLLVISHLGASTVDVFDPAKRRVVAQIANISQPRGMAVDARNNRVFVAAGNATIYVISALDWEVKDSFQVKGIPEHLALSSDGRLLFVAGQIGSEVDAIDISLRRPVATGDVNGRVGGIAAGDNDTLYVTLEGQAVALQLDSQMKIIARHALTAVQPAAIVYDPGRQRLYIAVRSAVLELDASSGAEITRVAAPRGVSSLWLDEASHRLFAGGGGSVLALNTAGNLHREDELPVDVKGRAVAYDSARGLLYLPGGREGRSKLLIVRQSGAASANQPAASAEANLRK